jgi:hypothetical protein
MGRRDGQRALERAQHAAECHAAQFRLRVTCAPCQWRTYRPRVCGYVHAARYTRAADDMCREMGVVQSRNIFDASDTTPRGQQRPCMSEATTCVEVGHVGYDAARQSHQGGSGERMWIRRATICHAPGTVLISLAPQTTGPR